MMQPMSSVSFYLVPFDLSKRYTMHNIERRPIILLIIPSQTPQQLLLLQPPAIISARQLPRKIGLHTEIVHSAAVYEYLWPLMEAIFFDTVKEYQAYNSNVWILPIVDSIDAPQEDLFGAEIVNENSTFMTRKGKLSARRWSGRYIYGFLCKIFTV